MTPPATTHTLRYVARTDRGLQRNTNQDSVFAGDRLLVVADGMGGHAAGDKASRLVVEAFAPLNVEQPGQDLLAGLIEATRAGNSAIAETVAEQPDLDGMGTTLTAMLFAGSHAALAHVGDSRAYLSRSGVLHQLTHDDSFVQSLIDEGRITEHQAHEHPQRNLLLRALTGEDIDPSLTVREISAGDRYMLCSDGLCGVVAAADIGDALEHPDPEVAADTLIQLALASGGPDNVTVVIADVVATGEPGEDAHDDARAEGDDPASTNPFQPLTRELPRVPLPPIPEGPAGDADPLDDDYGDDYGDDPGAGHADDRPHDDDSRPGARNRPGRGDGYDAARGRGSAPAARRGILYRLLHPVVPGADGRARTPRLQPWLRRTIAMVVALLLLGGVVTGATLWVRSQYYVSDQGNLVVVFRGVDGSLLGWRFSAFQETSCAGNTDCVPMKVSDLQPAAQNRVRAGIKAASLHEARDVVERLSGHLLPVCSAQAPDVVGDADHGVDVTCRGMP